ncbi:MAG: hypothetical protein A2231_06490 [Candidatus Firestonebacteria bacterium RIFOXYA2_FULL_40_8]|nr:MAG: hypothetical protein A2231_06490 [Candidatus Firestonebacteria bacterium RIFOXYA2_FULL_40_8]
MGAKVSDVLFSAVGDIAFFEQIEKDVRAKGFSWPFERMLPFLKNSDLLFGNMESVLIPKSYPKRKLDPHGLVSTLDGEKVSALLKQTGFDFLNMAANHVVDAGRVGMDYTKKCLEKAGIVTGGTGHSQKEARKLKVIEKNGITFGFLCYCEDSNYSLGHTEAGPAFYDVETILQDVKKNKKKVDILVISVHADLEFMPVPSVPRRDNFRKIARAGADIILAHHPHVPQGIETVNGCLIAYSLGNFVFPSHTSNYMKANGPYTAYSFLLNINVGKKGVKSFERIPCRINEVPDQRPKPLIGDEYNKIMKYYSTLDKLLKNDKFVRETWRKIAVKHLEIYIKRAGERKIENVIEEMVGRLCLVAENKSWMDEIMNMAKESWEKQKKLRDPLHKPNYRFQMNKNNMK